MSENEVLEFEMMYGSPCPTIPEGHESAGEFRLPRMNEYFLGEPNEAAKRKDEHYVLKKTNAAEFGKRLILKASTKGRL